MNDAILAAGNLNINRFFALDTRTYEPGVLDAATASAIIWCGVAKRGRLTMNSSKRSQLRSW